MNSDAKVAARYGALCRKSACKIGGDGLCDCDFLRSSEIQTGKKTKLAKAHQPPVMMVRVPRDGAIEWLPVCKAPEHLRKFAVDRKPGEKLPKEEAEKLDALILQAEKDHQKEYNSAARVLADMAKTYRERNAVYGDNFRRVGPMMRVLFPKGVPPEVLHSDQFHLFELILVKLSRFAVSDLKHVDSIHDAAVYAAMIEAILHEV